MHRRRIGRLAADVARVSRSSCPACRPRPGVPVRYEVVIAHPDDDARPPATCAACGRPIELVIDAGDDGRA